MRTVVTILAALWLPGFPVQTEASTQAPEQTPATASEQAVPAPPAAQEPAPASQQGVPVPPTPEQPVPGVTVPAEVQPVVPAPVVPPVPLGARAFTAPTGIIFSAVRPDRVADFEIVIGYLEAALEKSTDSGVRAQAAGWRVFRAVEPGPNSTVLYVFLIDPTVTGADYGLGRILSDAYPDQIQDIWKLYTGALAGGGSLLNLTAVQPVPLPPVAAPPPTPAVTPRASPPAPPGQ